MQKSLQHNLKCYDIEALQLSGRKTFRFCRLKSVSRADNFKLFLEQKLYKRLLLLLAFDKIWLHKSNFAFLIFLTLKITSETWFK